MGVKKIPFLGWICIALLLCVKQILALDVGIRETDSELLYINLPLEPDVLQDYLNPALSADTFNGTAWITMMVVHIDKLEVELPFDAWLPTGASGWLLKTFTYVTHGDYSGYMILTMDFEKGLSGWLQKIGCSATQKGVSCLNAEMNRKKDDETQTVIKSSDGASLAVSYHVTDINADTDMLTWFIQRDYKYEQDGYRGDVTVAKQEGKHDPTLIQGRVVSLSSFNSNIVASRFNWGAVESLANPCSDDVCFYSDSLLFVDHSGSSII